MSQSHRVLALAIVLAAAAAASTRLGQTQPAFQSSEPIALTCPSQPVPEGRPLSVTANLGRTEAQPDVQWSVSHGSIKDGQHTNAITVDTRGLAGSTVSVTMELGSSGCRKIFTCSTTITNAER